MKIKNLVLFLCLLAALPSHAGPAPVKPAKAAAPTISSVTPSQGPAKGGTEITISGRNLAGATSVTIDGAEASDVRVGISGTQVTATTPGGSAGAKEVIVTALAGKAKLVRGFTYLAAPELTSVSPKSGPLAGGTRLTLTGRNLTGPGGNLSGVSVNIGGATISAVAPGLGGSIVVTVPQGATPGATDVSVTTKGGSDELPDAFTYIAVPALTAIAPDRGPLAGGTVIKLSGTSLANPTSVTIGGVAATEVSANADGTEITATTPAGTAAGFARLEVTTAGGSASLVGGFTYLLTPIIRSVSPNSGPLTGSPIYIRGENLQYATKVTLGDQLLVSAGRGASSLGPAVNAEGTQISTHSHDVTTPGPRKLEIMDTFGVTAVLDNAYTYLGPTITSFTPTESSRYGGLEFVLAGANFPYGAVVTFGGVPATLILPIGLPDSSTIRGTIPHSNVSGPIDVVVSYMGESAVLKGGFTYLGTSITSIEPNSSVLDGGMSFTVVGERFFGTSAEHPYRILIGDREATSVVRVNSTTLTGVIPPESVIGPHDVVVLSLPTDTTVLRGGFSYIGPSIASVTPSRGSVDGNNRFSLIGTDFPASRPLVVTFGGREAHSLVRRSSTKLEGTTPVCPLDVCAGPVDVVVSTYSDTAISQGIPGNLTEQIRRRFLTSLGSGATLTRGFTYEIQPKFGASVAPTEIFATMSSPGLSTVTVKNISTASSILVINEVTSTNPAFSITPADELSRTSRALLSGETRSWIVTYVPEVNATSPSTEHVTTISIFHDDSAVVSPATFTINGKAIWPTLLSISPDSVGLQIGGLVTLTGTNFIEPLTVTIGDQSVTNTRIEGDGTRLLGSIPLSSLPATVDVSVTTPNGSAKLAGGFSYVALPILHGVSPSSGDVSGGTAVTITGRYLSNPTSVTIYGREATSVAVNADGTEVTAVTPASSSPGTTDIVVTTDKGSATLHGGFTYTVAPVITSVTPDNGPAAGGTLITIRGENLMDNSGPGASPKPGSGSSLPYLSIGGIAVAVESVDQNGTEMTATTPATDAPGAKDVVVTIAGSSGTLTGGFTYQPIPIPLALNPPPVYSAIVPDSVRAVIGPNTYGGAVIRISNEASLSDALLTISSMTLSGQDAERFRLVSPNPITKGNPVPEETVTIAPSEHKDWALRYTPGTSSEPTVTHSAILRVSHDDPTKTNPIEYTVVGKGMPPPPWLTGIAPSAFDVAGAAEVRISGANLQNLVSVTIGRSAMSGATVNSEGTEITAILPSVVSAGAAEIVVTTLGGTATLTDSFTYTAVPRLAGITPNSGDIAGGTEIKISGTDLRNLISVTIGGAGATGVTANSDGTEIAAIVPAAANSGAVDVVVTTTGGSASMTGGWTYTAPVVEDEETGAHYYRPPSLSFVAQTLVMEGMAGTRVLPKLEFTTVPVVMEGMSGVRVLPKLEFTTVPVVMEGLRE